jgi:photosynthetic reaction center H subunit
MQVGAFTEYLDVAQVVLYAFWIFFAGLIIYLRREDKREGYPLESDRKNVQVVGWPPMPAPKSFLLPHNGGVRTAPREERPETDINATPVAPWPGAPLAPNGDPMLARVGPGACPERADEPDLTFEGEPKIVPLRVATDFSIAERDPDPRGMPVIGADGVVGGTIADVWVDRSEPQIRYLEVEVAEGRHCLLPINFARFNRGKRIVKVSAILGSHFANVPVLADPDRVTLREEDLVCAYYGAGKLYAMPQRTEAQL